MRSMDRFWGPSFVGRPFRCRGKIINDFNGPLIIKRPLFLLGVFLNDFNGSVIMTGALIFFGFFQRLGAEASDLGCLTCETRRR